MNDGLDIEKKGKALALPSDFMIIKRTKRR
jgi:hypothetical protein